ncbi:hypothetical protein AB6H12_13150 [Proteus mirabilis]|uniref:hypothetical protein n=1 Tax=Proteus mirabilis TaxID=584 RepID=UPI0034DD4E9F
MKGDISFIDLTFWQRSENIFFEVVQNIIVQIQKNDFLTHEQAKKWLNSIRKISISIFDEYALSALGTQKSVSGCIKARNGLIKNLYSNKRIKKFTEDFKITKENGEQYGIL